MNALFQPTGKIVGYMDFEDLPNKVPVGEYVCTECRFMDIEHNSCMLKACMAQHKK